MFYSSAVCLFAGSGLKMPSESPSLRNSEEESDCGLSPYFPIVERATHLNERARELVRCCAFSDF